MAEVSKYKCKYCGRVFKKEKNCVAHEKEHEVNDNPDPLYHVKFRLNLMQDESPSVEVSLERLPTRLENGVQIWTQDGAEEKPVGEAVGHWYDGDDYERIWGDLHDHIMRRLAGKRWRWECASIYKLIDKPLCSPNVQEAIDQVCQALPSADDIEQYRKALVQYRADLLDSYERNAQAFVKAIYGDWTSWKDSPDMGSLRGRNLMKTKPVTAQYGFGSELLDTIDYRIDYWGR